MREIKIDLAHNYFGNGAKTKWNWHEFSRDFGAFFHRFFARF